MRLAALLCAAMLPVAGWTQEVFRCTAPDGKVTYQEVPCPKASEARKVDATPANTDFDPSQRERLLKQGDEAGKRLEARAAEDEADRRRRQEARERDEQRERETLDREEARNAPQYIYAHPPGGPRPPYPAPGPRPVPRPLPVPVPR